MTENVATLSPKRLGYSAGFTNELEFHRLRNQLGNMLMQRLGIPASSSLIDPRLETALSTTARFLYQDAGANRFVLIELTSGDELPFDDRSFDGGVMIQSGMGIQDKRSLFREIARVLRPGARFGVTDLMRVSDGHLSFPLPWAAESTQSHLSNPGRYLTSGINAGLDVVQITSRTGLVRDFLKRPGREPESERMTNLIQAIEIGCVSPVEIIFRKPGTDPRR